MAGIDNRKTGRVVSNRPLHDLERKSNDPMISVCTTMAQEG
jgi:hypothetical protein